MEAILNKPPPPDFSLAKGSCKSCHGTGKYGTLLGPEGRRTVLVCRCIARAMSNKAKEKEAKP